MNRILTSHLGRDVLALSKEKCEKTDYLEGLPCIELNCLSKSTGEILKTKDISETSGIRNRFSRGQVLFGKLRPYLKKFGRPNFDGACSTEIWVLDSNNEKILLQGYLFYFVQSREFMVAACTTAGTKMPRASWDVIQCTDFKLPSLADQGRIVEILSDADAAIMVADRLAKELHKKFIGYRNQVMGQIDRSMNVKTAIGEFASIPLFKAITSAENELLLAVSLHCKGIRVNEGRKVKINAKGRPYSKRIKGDFLIGRQNIHNGGFGIVPAELNGCIASNAITSLRLNLSLINDRFFSHYFNRLNFYRRLEVLMGGTGQKEIGESELMRIKISVPDMEKQNEIADKIDAYLHMAKMQEHLVSALKKQKHGLMQQLLTGRLRVLTKKRA